LPGESGRAGNERLDREENGCIRTRTSSARAVGRYADGEAVASDVHEKQLRVVNCDA
jgi:hypothetical protein